MFQTGRNMATEAVMRDFGPGVRAVIEALEEPALIVDHGVVMVTNAAARHLLGSRFEGRDVRLAIRHPQALEHILEHRSGDIEASGIAEPGRTWLLAIRELDEQTVLIRMIDR